MTIKINIACNLCKILQTQEQVSFQPKLQHMTNQSTTPSCVQKSFNYIIPLYIYMGKITLLGCIASDAWASYTWYRNVLQTVVPSFHDQPQSATYGLASLNNQVQLGQPYKKCGFFA